jgi:CRISPR-associated endoribonuclease Cas6
VSVPNRFFGREAHALFLDLVRRADPALAESLHAARGDKPFTVALLPSYVKIGGKSGDAMRFTAFEPRLARLLAENVLPNFPREIRLGNMHFTVGAPLTDRATHPWAGISDARALANLWFAPATRVDTRITLQFLTPTAHRQIHRTILFPHAVQLWGGWLRAWNTSAQPAFEDDLIAQIEQNVALSRYELKTEVADFGAFREAGWVGHATFTCFSKERALWRVLNLLADFAFYCGTGYKTTQGMGVTLRVD